MTLRQQSLGNDLLEFWRFSFQYGFEMTNYQRLKWPKDGEPEDLFDQQSPNLAFLPRQDIWRQFFTLVRARGFQAPVTNDTSFATVELPSPRPYEYPEDISEEIDVAKGCGKPYLNTVEADRFALSAESLQQSQIPARVTAGFLRHSVFKAFFDYLWDSNGQTHGRDPPEGDTDIQNHGEQLTRDVGGNVTATQNMDVDSGSVTESPLAPSTALTHNAVVVAPAADQPPSFCVMKITVGGTIRRLGLPIHEAFFSEFSSGLFSNNFNAQQMDGRSIAPTDATGIAWIFPRRSSMPCSGKISTLRTIVHPHKWALGAREGGLEEISRWQERKDGYRSKLASFRICVILMKEKVDGKGGMNVGYHYQDPRSFRETSRHRR
ncbi:hypothetical protein VN97_g12039 [Penicillium thymicola]|uniref:Uncharacterized protein n=1 Tax=Penicillium thymicola TaxID=293382 RepID=A0AAI9X2T6_PENTH|nr:hypothetical protein VN97_g12039 [Penicillium thymicola]